MLGFKYKIRRHYTFEYERWKLDYFFFLSFILALHISLNPYFRENNPHSGQNCRFTGEVLIEYQRYTSLAYLVLLCMKIWVKIVFVCKELMSGDFWKTIGQISQERKINKTGVAVEGFYVRTLSQTQIQLLIFSTWRFLCFIVASNMMNSGIHKYHNENHSGKSVLLKAAKGCEY